MLSTADKYHNASNEPYKNSVTSTHNKFPMKKFFFAIILIYAGLSKAQSSYTPTPENLAARKVFQYNKFGLFIHWGLSSVFGQGEWVMQNRKIKAADYQQYLRVFNPIDFDAEKGGITLI